MKEVNDNVIKKIFINVLKAIVITAVLLLLNIANIKLEAEIYKRVVQVATMLCLFVSIYLFERAYRQDKEETALDGIEIFVVSTFVLSIKYITQRFSLDYKNYVMLASFVFDIYFVLKSIFVYTKGRKEIADSFSDIKEIVKKDEPVKKEAVKRKNVEVQEKKDNIKTKKSNNAKKEVTSK